MLLKEDSAGPGLRRQTIYYMSHVTVAFLGFRFAILLQHSIKGDRTPHCPICIQNKAARRLGHWDTNLPLQPLPHNLTAHTHVHTQAPALGVRVCAPVRG